MDCNFNVDVTKSRLGLDLDPTRPVSTLESHADKEMACVIHRLSLLLIKKWPVLYIDSHCY